MGFFGKKRDKNPRATRRKSSEMNDSSSSRSDATTGRRRGQDNVTEPSLEMVPSLVADLRSSTITSATKPARALRMLFALSEHSSGSENRTKMVRSDNRELVPVLLAFLRRCDKGSSEQYLTLLVLNNLSIPSENKRLIALDCGGAKILAQLLCEDPSCHLMAIILVNLTFSDGELRNDLVDPEIQLIGSLAYALRLSAFTPEEYEARQPAAGQDSSPHQLLQALIAGDQRLRPALTDLDYNSGGSSNIRGRELLLDPSRQLYPETVRWCLSALKNLTRPSKDAVGNEALVKTGVVPSIMRMITVASSSSALSERKLESSENNGSQSSSSGDTPAAVDPEGDPDFSNSPAHWDANSVQDAALFVIMNLAASSVSRDHVKECDGEHILCTITEFSEHNSRETVDEKNQHDFQRLKACMTLSYLVGSEGHFGQPRMHKGSVASSPDNSVIILSANGANLLLELLGNTLHDRAKDGPGGYSAATFSVKSVLLAVRCFLTHEVNQAQFAGMAGWQLNALLIKSLAKHSIERSPAVDAEAAEHAAFSLYLQSSYGFRSCFLPTVYRNQAGVADTGTLAAKVLTSYIHMENITPAGRHAADQLLLRLRFLLFEGSIEELGNTKDMVINMSDYLLTTDMLAATESIIVEKRSHGARPRRDIFSRPILRSRAPKRTARAQAPWDNQGSVRVFSSALQAVQELSFGSTKVRHMDAIDDILIANNIANSANGEKTESYNYWWSWEDAAGEIQKNLERQRSADSASIFSGTSRFRNEDEPMSIFGFTCGPVCGINGV